MAETVLARVLDHPRVRDRVLTMLTDPRDLPLFEQAVRGSLLALSAPLVFVGVLLGTPAVALAACGVHLALYLANLERFITMFHDVNHRALFRAPWSAGNTWMRWVHGPVFGSPPDTYLGHHVLMHHPEDNGPRDTSSTLPYRRDSLRDLARYVLRFALSMPEVARYLHRRNPRSPWARRIAVGELGWWTLVTAALWVAPLAAVTVLIVPTLLTRCLLILGNWGEHAFVDPAAPDDPYRSSVDLRGPANARAYNVGYHIGHHIRPGAHFSSHPAWFAANEATFGAHDAVVFEGLSYPELALMVAFKRYDALARRFVRLRGAPERTHDEVVAMLKARTEPIHER